LADTKEDISKDLVFEFEDPRFFTLNSYFRSAISSSALIHWNPKKQYRFVDGYK